MFQRSRRLVDAAQLPTLLVPAVTNLLAEHDAACRTLLLTNECVHSRRACSQEMRIFPASSSWYAVHSSCIRRARSSRLCLGSPAIEAEYEYSGKHTARAAHLPTEMAILPASACSTEAVKQIYVLSYDALGTMKSARDSGSATHAH